MHDGSIATLEEVIEHYAAGGRAHTNPQKDKLLQGFTLTPQNRVDLAAFLRSLTDDSLIHDARFADPWGRPPGLPSARSAPSARGQARRPTPQTPCTPWTPCATVYVWMLFS
jgi:hypothetical protein